MSKGRIRLSSKEGSVWLRPPSCYPPPPSASLLSRMTTLQPWERTSTYGTRIPLLDGARRGPWINNTF